MSLDWSIFSNPIVVTVVGGFVGWLLTQFTNKKRMEHEKEINEMKLKADVVVKSRIAWIKEVRELSSRLIKNYTEMYATNANAENVLKSVNELNESTLALIEEHKTETDENRSNYLLEKITSNTEKLGNLKNEYVTLSNDLLKYVGQFSEIKFLFKSYFSEENIDGTTNEQNSNLIEVMEKCIALLTKYCTKPEEVNKNELQQSLDNFTYKFSKYIKEEWEKVKWIE
ncbi:hypothetical protein MT416_02210 [Mammaliicoccus sciuri]|uniref:hypothetical protein n=1 Tax=Mammaliicoccus sciuri TaxID=1296 RepID=UPI00132F8DD1|nr:hypothetical protein [Mammaliicoccus sciuri]MCJ1748108.1 hypothetical protein [Mammaliicoccus sciuri]